MPASVHFFAHIYYMHAQSDDKIDNYIRYLKKEIMLLLYRYANGK